MLNLKKIVKYLLKNPSQLLTNFLSDTSEKGLEQSLGFMVNYLYNLEEVEINHEKYVVDKKINTSKSLEKEFIKLNIEIGQK